MTPAVAKREQKRLQVALEHLKVLKEQYRRRRALQIQVYLDNFRRQQLLRAVLEEEEERYYRQCISAALEKRRVNAIFNNYLLQCQFQKQQLVEEEFGERLLQNEEKNEVTTMTSKHEQEEEEGYSEYHSQQLAELLKQIFDHQPVYDNDENDTEREMADVWQYILDTPGDEKPFYQFEVPMTEHGTVSPVPHLVTQDPMTAYTNQRERTYDEINQVPEKPQQYMRQDGFIQKEEDGKKMNIEIGNEGEEELKKLESEQEQAQEQAQEQQEETKLKDNKSVETSESSEESDSESLPPLQDHVLTLQNLINKLSSEPVMVGEQYVAPEPTKKDVQYPDVQSSDNQISICINNQSNLQTRDEDESPATFIPQSIITSAEPTPTIEQSVTDVDKEISDFVDSIAAEQKQDLSSVSDSDSLLNPRDSAKPDIFAQSQKNELNPFELDNAKFQEKLKSSDHSNASQTTLSDDQQPQQHQSVQEPIKEPKVVSSKPKSLYLNSAEIIPIKKEKDQRISANFNTPTLSIHDTNKAESVKKDDVLERDPTKQHIYKQLDQIERKLSNPDLTSRWERVLRSNLTFSKQGGGTLLLSASTQADREFLGLEDELTRVMLELDTVISEGDEGIRNHRRTLVKRCESMLDRLDQHKQKEWEKTIGTKHRRYHSHKK
ncbi:hypothetical protein K501DRAFT_287634 [Backusella circina FSU 941]|nr:hypothetical protein K501DRAFT_287634 [Backusella circina FSU 941]